MIAPRSISVPGRIEAEGLDWIVPAWPAPAQVGALMTSRNGGVSAGGAATLDLGPSDLGELEPKVRSAIEENRRRVARFLPSPPRYLRQVHGTEVAVVDAAASPGSPWPVADAAVTRASGVVLAVRVADCLPVLLCDAGGTVVGAAHAGWRGLAAGVLEAVVAAMACAPSRLIAWIGPGIGPESFEVGADVHAAFVERDSRCGQHFKSLREGKWLADLPALACDRLRQAGVMRITTAQGCTFRESGRYFSYRRDHAAGRMAAYVWRHDA